jgi:hypothetical protein
MQMADDYTELYTVRAKVKGKLEETMKKQRLRIVLYL